MQQKHHRYISNIISGKVNHGKHIRLLCEKLSKEIIDDDCQFYFDENEANRYIKFVESLVLTEGKWANKPFSLEDWQAFIVSTIFGWKSKETGLRRFDEVTIHIPKKNGKTFLGAALAVAYAKLEKNDYAGQIYMAATVREQANICFKAVKRFITMTPHLNKYFRVMQYAVISNDTQTNIKALPGDAASVEGFGSSLVIFDEYHLQKDDELKNNLITGQAARENSLFVSISTSGTDKNGPYYKHINNCKNILNGISESESHLCVLYEADTENWEDPNIWKQANPNYGISVLEEKLAKEFNDAKNDPSKIPPFITKHLNIWADSDKTWIEYSAWKKLGAKLDLDDFEDCDAWLGLDLAITGDFSALCVLVNKDGKYYLFYKYWIPDVHATRRSKADRLNFTQWQRDGYITITDGNVTDMNVIKFDIVNICNKLNVVSLAYDEAYAESLMTDLREDHGVNAEPFSQGIRMTSPPAMLFQRLVLGEEIVHDNNPVTAWMLGNVSLYYDINGNFKLSKTKSKNKIDGISATVNALGSYQIYYSKGYNSELLIV